jgi:flagellar M-ring protein FliF
MNPFERLRQLAPRQQLAAVLAACLTAAMIVATWMWSQAPDYRVLYTNLPEREGGSIVAALGQMNVPYKVAEGGGAIMVPANLVHETRLKLASQGLPKGGTTGFELMEQQKLGVTQFQEQVTYQRALEGELARSIQSLAAVQAARVHLAIPKPSVFLREQQKPTASVLLSMHPGRTLERAQIAGIVHLVASSVPELAARNVSVIDQSGALLNQTDGPTTGVDPAKLGYVRQVEQAYIRRILDLLEPLVGAANIRAQVTAEVDFTQSEQTAETYKPNQGDSAIRSQQTTETSSGDGTPAGGVPGAASNQPPGTQGTTAATAATVGSGRSSARKDATTNYEVDKTVRLTRETAGRVRRVNAAVVINHRRTVDAAGKAGAAPLAKEEIEQINALVREAIGFDQARGDSISISNTPFSQADPVTQAAPAPVPAWKDPENLALAKQGGTALALGALVLFLLFGVIRPLVRSVALRAPAPVAIGGDGVSVAIGAGAAPAALGAPAGQGPALPPGASPAQLRAGAPGQAALAGVQGGALAGSAAFSLPVPDPVFARAQAFARDNPRAAAAVIKKWLNGNE